MDQLIPRTLRLWENMSSNLRKSFVLAQLQKMTKGHLTLKIKGDPNLYSFGYGNKVKAEIFVENESFFQKFWDEGELGFGESYVQGDWNSPDLAQVIRWFFLNSGKIEDAVQPGETDSAFLQFMLGMRFLRSAAKIKRGAVAEGWAKRYDLERPFFSLMLDSRLNNSGALYHKRDSLDEAQIRKQKAIARELRLKPGARILELGCGWGGFAFYLAGNYDCSVTAVTVSEEQYEYVKAKAEALGLSHKIQPVHADYRSVKGSYDRIVSIELIDTIEGTSLPEFFERCDQWLKPSGIMVHQLLIRPDTKAERVDTEVWNQKHIAAGIKTPTLQGVLRAMSEGSDFCLRSLKDTGLSYSRTLHAWTENFASNVEAVRALGFDESFIRSWHYYLSHAEAAFEHGLMSSIQITVTRATERAGEWAESPVATPFSQLKNRNPFRVGVETRGLKTSQTV